MRSTTASRACCIALLFAAAGCMTDDVDVTAMPAEPVPDAMLPQHDELHRMFGQEKRDAASAELPPQF